MLVLIIRKYKFISGGGGGGGGVNAGSSTDGERQVYEEVDKGVSVSDPTYMDVGREGGGGGGDSFQLKHNSAYAATIASM